MLGTKFSGALIVLELKSAYNFLTLKFSKFQMNINPASIFLCSLNTLALTETQLRPACFNISFLFSNSKL